MIQKRGTRWRVVVQGPRDELTGKRRQLSGSAATEREAVELERSLRLQAERRLGRRVRLRDLVEEWWDPRPRLAPTTPANYRSNLDVHVLPVLGQRFAEEIRPRLVASFMRHLADKGLAPGTVRRVRTVLSAVMSYAVAMEYLESNPVMKVPHDGARHSRCVGATSTSPAPPSPSAVSSAPGSTACRPAPAPRPRSPAPSPSHRSPSTASSPTASGWR
jgi:hypothetical protein